MTASPVQSSSSRSQNKWLFYKCVYSRELRLISSINEKSRVGFKTDYDRATVPSETQKNENISGYTESFTQQLCFESCCVSVDNIATGNDSDFIPMNESFGFGCCAQIIIKSWGYGMKWQFLKRDCSHPTTTTTPVPKTHLRKFPVRETLFDNYNNKHDQK